MTSLNQRYNPQGRHHCCDLNNCFKKTKKYLARTTARRSMTAANSPRSRFVSGCETILTTLSAPRIQKHLPQGLETARI